MYASYLNKTFLFCPKHWVLRKKIFRGLFPATVRKMLTVTTSPLYNKRLKYTVFSSEPFKNSFVSFYEWKSIDIAGFLIAFL